MGLFPLPGPDETPGPRITRGPVFLCVNLSGSYGKPSQFARSNGLDRHHRAGFRFALATRDWHAAWCGMDLGTGAPRDPEAPGGFEPAHSGFRPGRAGALLPDAS